MDAHVAVVTRRAVLAGRSIDPHRHVGPSAESPTLRPLGLRPCRSCRRECEPQWSAPLTRASSASTRAPPTSSGASPAPSSFDHCASSARRPRTSLTSPSAPAACSPPSLTGRGGALRPPAAWPSCPSTGRGHRGPRRRNATTPRPSSSSRRAACVAAPCARATSRHRPTARDGYDRGLRLRSARLPLPRRRDPDAFRAPRGARQGPSPRCAPVEGASGYSRRKRLGLRAPTC